MGFIVFGRLLPQFGIFQNPDDSPGTLFNIHRFHQKTGLSIYYLQGYSSNVGSHYRSLLPQRLGDRQPKTLSG